MKFLIEFITAKHTDELGEVKTAFILRTYRHQIVSIRSFLNEIICYNKIIGEQ